MDHFQLINQDRWRERQADRLTSDDLSICPSPEFKILLNVNVKYYLVISYRYYRIITNDAFVSSVCVDLDHRSS